MVEGLRNPLELVRNLMNFYNPEKYTLTNKSLKNNVLLGKIGDSLDDREPVVLLYFDIAKFHEIEQVSGSEVAARVLSMFKETLGQKIPELFQNAEVLAVENLWGDDFIVLLTLEEKPDLATLQDIAITSRIGIRESIKQELLKITGVQLDIHVGYAVLDSESGNPESRLYNGVREAQGIAKGYIDLQTARLLPEFRQLLHNMSFNAVLTTSTVSKAGTASSCLLQTF